MVDREKFIKGLECCILEGCDKNCPYWDNGEQCRSIMEADALALLKAQEPVKPKKDDAWPFPINVCGACGTCLFCIGGNYKAKYCSECGRKVKWDA